jgi:hypothetical protein
MVKNIYFLSKTRCRESSQDMHKFSRYLVQHDRSIIYKSHLMNLSLTKDEAKGLRCNLGAQVRMEWEATSLLDADACYTAWCKLIMSEDHVQCMLQHPSRCTACRQACWTAHPAPASIRQAQSTL